jgi:hypothetical protein
VSSGSTISVGQRIPTPCVHRHPRPVGAELRKRSVAIRSEQEPVAGHSGRDGRPARGSHQAEMGGPPGARTLRVLYQQGELTAGVVMVAPPEVVAVANAFVMAPQESVFGAANVPSSCTVPMG